MRQSLWFNQDEESFLELDSLRNDTLMNLIWKNKIAFRGKLWRYLSGLALALRGGEEKRKKSILRGSN